VSTEPSLRASLARDDQTTLDNPVVKVNDAALEAALGHELEPSANAIRQRTLTASNDDRVEEQVTLVDQARGDGLASELRTADRDVAT
jgi:hypothetical protein